jgi:hypothetical protein
MEHLQSLQYDAVHKFCRFPEEFDSDLVIAQVHVGFFMSLAGVFWKNPKVLEDNRLIIDVLRVLQKTSVMMLIPHIEEWLYSRAEPGAYEENPDDGYTSVSMRDGFGQLDAGARATFGRTGAGSLSIEDDHGSGNYSIFTVEGLYRGFRQQFVYRRTIASFTDEEYGELQALTNRAQLAKYPILQLIDDSEPHTWWVFDLDGLFRKRVFLASFKRKIFWHRCMSDVICVWNSGDGMWDPERWSLAEALSPHSQRSKTISEAFDDGGEGTNERGENEEDHPTQSDTDGSVTSVSDWDNDEGDFYEITGQADFVDCSNWLVEAFSYALC